MSGNYRSAVMFIVMAVIAVGCMQQAGTISGRVTDSLGNALAGVTVITNPGNFSAVTNNLGNYGINDVPVGNYMVVATSGTHTASENIMLEDTAMGCNPLLMTTDLQFDDMTGGGGTPGGGAITGSTPVVSGITESNLGTTGVSVSWDTDIIATSQVEYGTDTGYGNTTTQDTGLVTGHSAGITGLSAGTLYHYRVISVSSGGATGVSADGTFTTASNGSGWGEAGYNDGSWASGPGVLGFGELSDGGPVVPIATTVSYGPDENNKYITTYFRKSFQVSNAVEVASMTLHILFDDAFVVHLNGQEIARDHLPSTGTVTYDMFASELKGTGTPGNGETDYEYNPVSSEVGKLVTGTNVLAVEIHQCNLTSSDLGMDVHLVYDDGTGAGTFISKNATWKYLDTGVDLGAAQ